MKDNANLDLMRSTAVLLVIVSHLLFYLPHSPLPPEWLWLLGLIGVFIFFTHTTLVLMWSLERDPHTIRFYIRRAFRIYPLWLAVLAITLLLKLPCAPYYAPAFRFYQPGWRELAENALLLMNLSTKGTRVVGASWSLPVEVEMYLVLPFLFFFIRQTRELLPLLLVDLLAIATAFHLDPPVASDLLFCTPLFLPGAMAYLLYQRIRPRIPAWLFPLWLCALITVFDRYGSVHRTFRAGWPFCLLLGVSLPCFQAVKATWLTKPAHYIAKYSYGLYLCHIPAIAVGLHFFAGHSLFTQFGIFAFTAVFAAVLFYHLVEEPMIGVGRRVASHFESGSEPPLNRRSLALEVAP